MIATRLLGTDPATGPLDALRILATAGPVGPHDSAADSPADSGRCPPADAVLVHTPQARANPFADLLNGALPAVGVIPVPAVDPAAAAALAGRLAGLSGGAVGCVVHLHWLHRVTTRAADEAGAERAVRTAVATLAAARANGARVLWTVHNVGPHRSRHPRAEALLRREVAGLADLVHVMNPRTAELLAHTTPLDPDRVRVLPHPSYLGAYPDTVSGARARQLLGIPRDATVLVVFGRIQAYKGLDVLADAFDRLAADEPGRYRLLVVGAVDGVGPGPVRPRPGPADPGVRDLLARFARHPDVVCHPLPVADAEVQVVLRAGDLAVVPNLVPLNSGAELLAQSFDLPVVTTGEVSPDADWGVPAPPGDVDGLLAALRTALRRFTGPGAPAARAAAATRAAAVAPGVVGPAFARLVRDLIDSPAAPASAPGPADR